MRKTSFPWIGTFAALCAGALVAACTQSAPPSPPAAARPAAPSSAGSEVRTLADFEQPADDLEWRPLSAAPPGTAPATEPAATEAATAPATTAPAAPAPLARSSVRPNTGLWSERLSLARGEAGGSLVRKFASPVDLGASDIAAAALCHLGPAARNGKVLASLVLIDSSGKRVEGDAFPITTHWEAVACDLHLAFERGLDLSRIASMGVVLRSSAKEGLEEPLEIQTDTWTAEQRRKTYFAPAQGAAKANLSVVSRGGRLRIGTEAYQITLWDRGTVGSPDDAAAAPGPAWLEIATGADRKPAIGPPGTGLSLLDAESFDALRPAVRRDADDAAASPPPAALPSLLPWPFPRSGDALPAMRGHWEVVWTSPLAALVEYRQEFGPYDRLGEPAALLTWRFMVYQWGQAFVHAEWTKSGAPPVSWALALDRQSLAAAAETTGIEGADAQRLLTEIYPATLRQGLQTALPHRMQSGAPVAMISKGLGSAARNSWWWADARGPAGGDTFKMFGCGLGDLGAADGGVGGGGGKGHADCMLLLNAPTALVKAGTFGQYLVPPKLVVRQGELDRNFPGDAENDGFVEAYGFQVIRLANGRALFTIYPQGRPIFYPAYLFTVPAVEREALDVAHSRVLINLDGQQFADPPRFPDGSFLLQLPYVLDKPVTVEAVLVKR